MDRTAVGRACAILGTVALLATVGCGDDGNDGESSAQESSSSTTAPPTGEETTDRDEYVERANEGCEEAIAEFSELAPELGENPTDAEIVAFAEVLVELNRAMVTVFEELPVPEGDEDVIRSIIDGSIEATDELEADPVSVFKSGENPYEAVNTEIVAYGLSSCADSADTSSDNPTFADEYGDDPTFEECVEGIRHVWGDVVVPEGVDPADGIDEDEVPKVEAELDRAFTDYGVAPDGENDPCTKYNGPELSAEFTAILEDLDPAVFAMIQGMP
jgi:hypothetical protein